MTVSGRLAALRKLMSETRLTPHSLSDTKVRRNYQTFGTPDEIVWLSERVAAAHEVFTKAKRAGEELAGRRFLVACTRLLGLMFLERVIGEPPCTTHRLELSMAWRSFRRHRRTLEKRGILPRLWPPEVS